MLEDSDKKVSFRENQGEICLSWKIPEKLFSCKILAEWMVILQDPDKIGYLGKLWQK